MHEMQPRIETQLLLAEFGVRLLGAKMPSGEFVGTVMDDHRHSTVYAWLRGRTRELASIEGRCVAAASDDGRFLVLVDGFRQGRSVSLEDNDAPRFERSVCVDRLARRTDYASGFSERSSFAWEHELSMRIGSPIWSPELAAFIIPIESEWKSYVRDLLVLPTDRCLKSFVIGTDELPALAMQAESSSDFAKGGRPCD